MSQGPVRDQWESWGSAPTMGRGCAKKNIQGNATTTVKSSAGMLHCIQVNTKASGGTATVYDNTAASGTVIAVIDTSLTGSAGNTLFYDVAFQTGLTIVTANASTVDLAVAFQ